jgi:hypothetical protein
MSPQIQQCQKSMSKILAPWEGVLRCRGITFTQTFFFFLSAPEIRRPMLHPDEQITMLRWQQIQIFCEPARIERSLTHSNARFLSEFIEVAHGATYQPGVIDVGFDPLQNADLHLS